METQWLPASVLVWITTLAGAYSGFYTANGAGPAKTTLNTAIKRINSLCPDAGAAA